MTSEMPKLPRCKADDDNMEKLHQAARRGQTELVRRLVASGIPINIPNKFGCTALHLACKNGHTMTVKELGLKANLSGSWHGRKPLHLAVAGGHKDCVVALIESAKIQGLAVDAFVGESDDYEMQEIGKFRKVCSGQSALHWAVGMQSKEMVGVLLSLGCSASCRDKNGESVLCRTIEFGDEEMFDILMATKPRLDTTDRFNRNALHWAIGHHRLSMAQKLFAAGCDVNQEDTNKVTPVWMAAQHMMTKLLQQLLTTVDNDGFYSYPIHNGKDILEDRVGFQGGTTDEHLEVIREMQTRLDMINKDKGDGKSRQPNKGPAIYLAPSAPIKKQ
eukprot:PhF_6_TR42724/c0_g1_i1/m.64552